MICNKKNRICINANDCIIEDDCILEVRDPRKKINIYNEKGTTESSSQIFCLEEKGE